MISNVALSYIAMLSVVGFFLWVIRNFVRGLRQKSQLSSAVAASTPITGVEKKNVNWPVYIFLNKNDDIPIPGRIVSVDQAGAFMESSACLQTGQEISVYVNANGEKTLCLTAKVVWARSGHDGRNASQLTFPSLNEELREKLFAEAG